MPGRRIQQDTEVQARPGQARPGSPGAEKGRSALLENIPACRGPQKRISPTYIHIFRAEGRRLADIIIINKCSNVQYMGQKGFHEDGRMEKGRLATTTIYGILQASTKSAKLELICGTQMMKLPLPLPLPLPPSCHFKIYVMKLILLNKVLWLQQAVH